MKSTCTYLLTCPKGLESLLLDEVRALGDEDAKETHGGVWSTGDQRFGYRLCLWSRFANRVLFQISDESCEDSEQMYAVLRAIPWEDHIDRDGTFAVNFTGKTREIRNSHFGALKCKDAVVDWFLAEGDVRPSIDTKQPNVRLDVRLRKGRLQTFIDLSGDSMHRRGYRQHGALAPLKENLAAAILTRADWLGHAARGEALLDPMCGSGTLLIEGALMALGIAPGLLRKRWGFSGWLGHIPAYWNDEKELAQQQRGQAFARQWPEIRGWDSSGKVIAQAEDNIRRAGLQDVVKVSRKDLADFRKPTHVQIPSGLVLSNPPYGERMGEEEALGLLYKRYGDILKDQFVGWKAAIFTGSPELGKGMGLRSHKQYQFQNGEIECKLLLFDVEPSQFVETSVPARGQISTDPDQPLSSGAQMFANRLAKNQRQISKWLKQEGITCYRVYDADMPEYAVAIDVYGEHVHVAEYAPPASIDPAAAERRLSEVMSAVPRALNVPASAVALKQRRQQSGRTQYNRQDDVGEFHPVNEGQVQLLVNLHDYLDTGLFLDHRAVRLDIAERCKDKRFLNLFCYTAAATVHAIAGGARFTTSVDTSNTYLKWAAKNFALNGFSETRNRLVRADAREWLKTCDDKFDVILLDPPTFSNSKSADESFEVQRDHEQLIEDTMKVLAPKGTLIFSNNRRDFELEIGLTQRYKVEDKTRWSTGRDFPKPLHKCWYIRHA